MPNEAAEMIAMKWAAELHCQLSTGELENLIQLVSAVLDKGDTQHRNQLVTGQPFPTTPDAGTFWEGPIFDAERLETAPDGTVSIDDVGTLRQRRTGQNPLDAGWTQQGYDPITSEVLLEGGTRPVYLLRVEWRSDAPTNRKGDRPISRGPSFSEFKSVDVESREFHLLDRRPDSWSEWAVFSCPFCGQHQVARVWDVAGRGHRCECGALFSAGGQAYHYKPTEQER